MHNLKKPGSGPWIFRFFIWILGILLGLLFFWLLGFIMKDIETTKGPEYQELRKEIIGKEKLDELEDLNGKIYDIQRLINNRKEQREVLADTSENLKKTVDQLVDFQKLSLEKGSPIPEEQKENFNKSLDMFLANQAAYQKINSEIASLLEQKGQLETRRDILKEEIDQLNEPLQKAYGKINRQHKIKMAAIQLSVLIPVLIISVILLLKWRGKMYFPLILAFAGATLLRGLFVIHEYFPARIFKYMIILAAILALLRIIVFLIRLVVAPSGKWLQKQYRDAYEHFLCPVCEYPIRRGPMKYLFWTRRSIKKIKHQAAGEKEEKEYTCPSCCTTLYEKCPECGKIRPALLPCCPECGDAKENLLDQV
mgnify:CR=1 FL=1